MNETRAQLILKDSRLSISAFGRSLITGISILGWISCSIIASSLILFGKASFKWAGLLLALFVLDRILHLGRGDKSLLELPLGGKANLSEFLTPNAIDILAEARGNSSKGTDFNLEVLRALLKKAPVRKIFYRLGAPASKIILEKLKIYLKKEEAQDTFKHAENLARLSLMQALKSGSEDVGILDILAALSESDDRKFVEFLNLISLKPQLLKWGAALAEPKHIGTKEIAKKDDLKRIGIPLPPMPAQVKLKQ